MSSGLIIKMRRFLVEEDGPTAIEYAVMMMLIFLAVVSMVQLVGLTTAGSMQNSADLIDQAVSGS